MQDYYSSPAVQLYALLHFGFSITLLMIYLPKFLFAQSSGDKLEDRFARYSKAVCLYIILIYLLTLIRLYEVISFTAVILLISTYRYWRRGAAEDRDRKISAYAVWFYELTEIGFRIRTRWKKWRGTLSMARKNIRLKAINRGNPLLFITIGGVLAATAYVRFYDAMHHAPPPLSDGVVMLAWIKYIDQRQLFTDGVYPQGYSIYMSLIGKFAAIDRLFVLKYTGPLNGVLTALGGYFCLSRMTGSKGAGIIGATMFGIGGVLIFGTFDWMRQAASNAQEFALVFVFPSLYFILKYLQEGHRRNLWNGIAACAAAGFVHSLMFAYLGMGIFVVLLAGVMTYFFRHWKRYMAISLFALAALVITYLPLQLGEWAGVQLHGTSATFLVATADVPYPELNVKDYVGLGAIALIALSALIRWRDRSHRLYEWFMFGLGAATFLLYYWAPVFTQSVLLASRTGSMWTVYTCFGAGFAWWSLWRLLPTFKRSGTVHLFLSGVVAVALAGYFKLQPIEPYKMQWDSEASMYLKIASIHTPMTWTIFSNDQDYALVLGRGWHQYLRTLIDNYDPTGTPITRNGQDEYDDDVTPWMYVFQQKNVFKVEDSNDISSGLQETYAQEEKDNQDLELWLAKYEPIHGRPPIIYEDENLRVYLIERPDAKDKQIRRIWGQPDKS